MKDNVELSGGLVIPGRCLTLSFSRSGGPGGQNVNKVETRVVLRFDLMGCEVLDDTQRSRVAARLRGRLTGQGHLVFSCGVHRERSRNLSEVLERFRGAMEEALRIRPRRLATRPTRTSRMARLEGKRRRGNLKRTRKPPSGGD